MIEELISIVVPVYNVEKYLDRCLNSVVNQTYTKLEIILVDDCATDASGAICDEWSKRDSRIKVIHKTVNQGLGFARNTGIDHASGKYIYFLDSDDFIEPDLIENCYRMALKEKADIVCFGNDNVTSDGTVVRRKAPYASSVRFTGKDVIETVVSNALKCVYPFSLSACFCLISMSVVEKNKWRFVSEREILCEDFYSMIQLYAYSDCVVLINKVFYHYVTNPKSLSQIYREDRYEKIRKFSEEMHVLIERIGYKKVLSEGVATTYLGLTMGAMKQIVASEMRLNSKLNHLKSIIADDHLQKTLETYGYRRERMTRRCLYRAIVQKSTVMCYFIIKVRNIVQ